MSSIQEVIDNVKFMPRPTIDQMREAVKNGYITRFTVNTLDKNKYKPKVNLNK